METVKFIFINDDSPNISSNTYTSFGELNGNEVKALTDRKGNLIDDGPIVPLSHILKNNNVKLNNHFYAHDLVVTGFINNNKFDTNIESFGTGVYGTYNKRKGSIRIDVFKPFKLLDEYHADSVRIANLQTNLYISKCILELKTFTFIDFDMISELIDNTWKSNIDMLWYIVFKRSEIDLPDLKYIMKEYLLYYFLNNNEIDSFIGEIIKYQPINFIMYYLDYDSIIVKENSAVKGCILYNFDPKYKKMKSRNIYVER
jgi:hypothetical protein